MNAIDALLAAVNAEREKRKTQLREALLDPVALREMIYSDSAEVAASCGGYAVPLDRAERVRWINEMFFKDPVFHAHVTVIAHLVREYAEFGR